MRYRRAAQRIEDSTPHTCARNERTNEIALPSNLKVLRSASPDGPTFQFAASLNPQGTPLPHHIAHDQMLLPYAFLSLLQLGKRDTLPAATCTYDADLNDCQSVLTAVMDAGEALKPFKVMNDVVKYRVNGFIVEIGSCEIYGPPPRDVAASEHATWDDVKAAIEKVFEDCQNLQPPVGGPMVGGYIQVNSQFLVGFANANIPLNYHKADFKGSFWRTPIDMNPEPWAR
ncbi:MAG: hypothetical protein LQ350_004824 [Teloschistes chrysophthalmus]|nr:MAG: hypothetical protein LQ350_004824 [Niorma chrysophthalma]